MISETKKTARVCVNCGKISALEIRRDELFGHGADAVIIEDIPMMLCQSCGLTYLEPQVSRKIDEICAHPELHASFQPKQVAKMA